MKIINRIQSSVIVLLLTVLGSCSGRTGIQVSVSLIDQFPEATISGPDGKVMSLIPEDKTTGSIGYESEGEVFWIKGLPKKSSPAENTLAFTWTTVQQTKITLSIEKAGDDFMFSLSQIGDVNNIISGWYVNVKASEDEYFTGIFERVVDGHQNNSWADGIEAAMNLRGQRTEVKLNPTVSAYSPFYLSSENYGFFAGGTWPGVIDFCKENPGIVKIAFEGPEFIFKVYTADNPMEIVRKHALETGPSVIPPAWAFGPWRWRDEHSNNAEYYDGTQKKAPYNTDIVEDVLMMQAYDIPCTAHWIDRPWATGPNGFDDYEFNTTQFPDPEGMIRWLNSKDLELMMWISPFVMGKMAEYAEKNNYSLVSKIHGNSPGQVLIDFSNPDAVKWWGENGPGKLAKMGIRGFKLDRADGEKLTDSLHLLTSSGKTYRENYNDFPHQFVKAAYDAVQPVLGDNFILYPRAQYTGSAKYGAMWAGDTDGKPEGLRSAIIGLQRCAVMGYPLWASDIGGYWGSFSRETAMRWIAFGCFSPIMETGPTNNTGFWNNPEAPHYDSELIATWRLYSKIRMKIKDYVAEQARKAHDDGTPVVRPLFLDYPAQKEAWEEWQTYKFGPDILVSPVWRKDATEQTIWLPEGDIWIDAWAPEKEHAGGNFLTVETPLYSIPVFIRKGSEISLGNLHDLYLESLEIAKTKPNLTALENKEVWKK
ncbi:MAG TPA: TIM-barrel domain-containing protein [Bacteroidales bacterium]|nr:TIM-barrel domain-containing protein [Bacteroidales bacterium]